MNKDPLVFLQHILNSIEEIEKDTKGLTKEQFLQQRIVTKAVLWNIEVIGEAAKNIPADFRKEYPKIPWRSMAGMRDKLIHEYFGIDLGNVWKVVKEDIPVLKEEIRKIINEKNKKTNNNGKHP